MREIHHNALDPIAYPTRAYMPVAEKSPHRQPRAGHSSNLLLQAGQKLLNYICLLQKKPSDQDYYQLQQDLQGAVRTFSLRATQDDYPNEVVLIARYILCATLDETLLHHPKLEPETWKAYCLLESFPVEHLNQDQFFLALERLCDNPVRYVDALEIIYLCLSLGFEGSYRALPRGQAQLALYLDKLFHLIKEQRGEVELMIAPQSSSPYKHKPTTVTNHFKLWRPLLGTLGILAAIYGGFSYTYYSAQRSLLQTLPIALSIPPIETRSTS